MFLLYLDEFGHPGPYAPADVRYRHHPLFGFAGLAIPGERWRDLDRTFLRLKTSFYSSEIARARTLEGMRPERWEPKTLRSRRDRRFAVRVMNLVQELGGSVFGFGCVKHTTPDDHSYDGLYNSLVQGALRQFERFLRDRAGRRSGRGIVIMDRRTEYQNRKVLESAQSHLFSDPLFKTIDVRIVETPLLVPSEWYHGVQAADVIGRSIGALYCWKHLQDPRCGWTSTELEGHLDAATHKSGAWSSVFIQR